MGLVEDLPDRGIACPGPERAIRRFAIVFRRYDRERGRRLGRLMPGAGATADGGAASAWASPFRSRRARLASVRHAAARDPAGPWGLRSGRASFRTPQRLRRRWQRLPHLARRGAGADHHRQRPAGGRHRGPGGVAIVRRSWRTKLEEVRQAVRFHGGVVKVRPRPSRSALSGVEIPSRRLRAAGLSHHVRQEVSAPGQERFDRPLGAHRSVGDLFTRGVRPELRPIAGGEDQLLCPCDGRVQELGAVSPAGSSGSRGSSTPLIPCSPGPDARRFEGGKFGVFFLSPNDCHRVVSPQDARVEEVVHVPGSRLLVHPPISGRSTRSSP